jgi:hypothetical protein
LRASDAVISQDHREFSSVRILDPDNDKIQLDTVFKAARVLGRELRLELI